VTVQTRPVPPITYEPPIEPLHAYVCPDCDEPLDIIKGAVTVSCPNGNATYPWQTVYAYTIKHWALRAEAAVAKLEAAR